jgi:sulfur carrier protein ThiS
MDEIELLKNIDKKLSAIIALIIQDGYKKSEEADKKLPQKVEILLAELGFNAPEIARLLNKKVSAVQKAIQRARK